MAYETSPEGSSASVPVMMTRDMEQQLADLGMSEADRNRLTPQEAWDFINEKQESAEAPGAFERMPEADSPKSETDGEEQINEKNKEIERLTNVVESTKTELNAARERLGMPPITEDPPSVAAEKKNLDALKKEQEDLAREMEEIRQKEKERLIREEKEKILQEKIDELFIELDALNADDLKSILGNGRMKDGKSLESRSMGTLDDVTAKDLAKAFAEGIKLLPKILELLPELMKQFDAELEKQAKERVEKKLKEEEEKKEVEKKKGVATETPEQPPTPIISEASQVAEQVGEAGTK